MLQDKLTIILKDLNKFKTELKDAKKDLKSLEKIENETYQKLKQTYKDLREQIKDFEENHRQELLQDDHYNQLRELVVEKEEEIAHTSENLFQTISKLPRQHFQMKIDSDNGFFKVDITPEMRIYLNGKEEKPRV